MKKALAVLTLFTAAFPTAVFSQSHDFIRDTIVSRLKNSRDFTLKVADAMPASDYDFKLTKPQMSFAQQMAHIGESMDYFMSVFSGEKPHPAKPTSMSKTDVMAYVKAQYDKAIESASKLTSEQIEKNYKGGEGGSMNGLADLIAMLEHAAHHRASAEMYLRAKGITPPSYMD
jgi:uncharacterized damage-inducible protein DinB